MADIICRWRNGTPKTVVDLVNSLPHEKMSNKDFRIFMQHSQWGSEFFHTPYQLACQLGLYCEAEDGFYYPRFDHDISESEAQEYLEYWMPRYYVPNPYVGRNGFNGITCPTYVLFELYNYAIHHANCTYKEAYETIFQEKPTNNNDIVKNYINNYSKVLHFDANGCLIVTKENPITIFNFMDRSSKKDFFDNFSRNNEHKKINFPRQQIYYGAPGTGKSHKIDEQTNDKNSIRTTFHPDTDYATFVGAYKPMMDAVDEYALDATGKTHKIDYPNGKSSIIYKYEPQVFLKAYVEAWGKHLNKEDGKDNRYYLVIEEINRGNCAQIFGDLFQLLDREDDGFSSYAISPESAITKYLDEEAKSADGKKFSELDFKDVTKERNGVTKTIATADDLRTGKRLVLPPNLYIWATMNTSDQSLFPIDSAFKRRWDWKYVSISNANKGYKIDINGKQYDWWQFLDRVNTCIGKVTSSEDKKLGYFFCKADKDNNTITADRFVNKVIFYIWGDVLKDYEPSELQFTYDNENLSLMTYKDNGNDIAFNFSSFFKADGEVNCDMARKMLENIGLKPIGKNDDGNLQQDANAEDDADKQANDNA